MFNMGKLSTSNLFKQNISKTDSTLETKVNQMADRLRDDSEEQGVD